MHKIQKIWIALLGCMSLVLLSSVPAYAEPHRPPDGGGYHYGSGRGHHSPPPPKKGRVHHDNGGAAGAVAAGAVAGAVLADAALNTAAPVDDVYVFGVGVRGFGNAVTDMRTGGGIGAYVWVRPIRWISVEAYSDLVFNERRCYGRDEGYLRIPFYVGLRAHVFDYSAFDLYGAVAGGVNFQYGHDDQEGFGGGMHIGGGVSFKASKFDIGFDIRYTVESNDLDFDRSVIHGCTFALTMGLAV